MKDSPKKNKKQGEKKLPQNKNNRNDNGFIIPVISLLIILLVVIVYNFSVKQQIATTLVRPDIPFTVSDFPVLEKKLSPDITAESAIILDNSSGVVLYEKKPTLRFSMASTTKIMTSLVALDHFGPKDVLTVYSSDIEGAEVGFESGDKVYFEDMLYGLMLPSGNDAAYAIAENYPGGVPAFVEKMNEKAAALGLNYTHYADPAGLDDDGNYTTVHDLAKLASYATQNKTVATIVSTKHRTIRTIDGTHEYSLYNLNKLLGENGVIGMKTGFTQGAGGVLVTTKIEKDHTFIIVVMKSEDRFADTELLLSYISNTLTFINPQKYLLQNTQKKE